MSILQDNNTVFKTHFTKQDIHNSLDYDVYTKMTPLGDTQSELNSPPGNKVSFLVTKTNPYLSHLEVNSITSTSTSTTYYIKDFEARFTKKVKTTFEKTIPVVHCENDGKHTRSKGTKCISIMAACYISLRNILRNESAANVSFMSFKFSYCLQFYVITDYPCTMPNKMPNICF